MLVEDMTGGASADAHQVTLDSVNLMFGITAPSDEVIRARSAHTSTTGETEEHVAQLAR